VEPINPLLSVHAALTRQSLSGEPRDGWFPDERVTPEEVLRGFTRIPAWVSRKEDRLGGLAAGKKADLVVFGQDLFRVPPDRLSSVPVELTMVDGEIVYRAEHGMPAD
jgi:predicted amidohydrolase YtcJ